jgi:hypothetical protein
MSITTFDTTILKLESWAQFAGSLPKIALLGGLALVAGLALALLLTMLFPPASDMPADGEVGGRTMGTASQEHLTNSGSWTEAVTRSAAVLEPALVSGRASHADDPLYGAGFSPTDVAALQALRHRVERGEVSEHLTVAEGAAFARWLVEHGRISG